MSDAITEVGKNAHGQDVVAGTYVVSPNGDLVLLAPNRAMKPGWRLATADDIAAKAAAELARKEAENPAPAK